MVVVVVVVVLVVVAVAAEKVLSMKNWCYVAGIVKAAETLPDVTSVLRRFHLPSLQRHVVVDVVCCQGQTWVKFVARNSKALTMDLNGILLLAKICRGCKLQKFILESFSFFPPSFPLLSLSFLFPSYFPVPFSEIQLGVLGEYSKSSGVQGRAPAAHIFGVFRARGMDLVAVSFCVCWTKSENWSTFFFWILHDKFKHSKHPLTTTTVLMMMMMITTTVNVMVFGDDDNDAVRHHYIGIILLFQAISWWMIWKQKSVCCHNF